MNELPPKKTDTHTKKKKKKPQKTKKVSRRWGGEIAGESEDEEGGC